MAFFNGFDVFRFTADGVPVRLTNATINVTEVGGGSLGTVTSDEFGYVEGANLGASAGAVVEFRHPSYQGRFRRTLASSAEAATELLDNLPLAFVVQDLRTTEVEPVTYKVWVEDRDHPETADRFLGYAQPGATTSFSYETLGPMQHVNVYLNPITAEGAAKFPLHKFGKAEPLSIASSAPDTRTITVGVTSLFDHVEDTTTASTSEESLYLNTLVAGKLDAVGDKIAVEYAGVYAATSDGKRIDLYFDNTPIFTAAVTENGTHWRLKAIIQRVDASTVRTVAQFSSGVAWEPVYHEISATLSSPCDLEVRVNDDAPGGTTGKMAHGIFIPGIIEYITYKGAVVNYHGVPLT